MSDDLWHEARQRVFAQVGWEEHTTSGGEGGVVDPVEWDPGPIVHLDATFDCRYAGQSHELNVRHPRRFHREHRLRNGYERPDHPVEVVAVRARAWIDSPVQTADLPIPERRGALGPAVIAEPDCTIWVPDGWSAEPGAAGALVLRRWNR